MQKVISVFSPKGGCGKTTKVLDLSMSIIGKTLIIDADPQGDCGERIGIEQQEFNLLTLYRELLEPKELTCFKVKQVGSNYFLASNIGLGLLDPEYMMSLYLLKWDHPYRLSMCFKNTDIVMTDEFGNHVSPKQIIIDTNPAMNMFSGFLIGNSDGIIVPVDDINAINTLIVFEKFIKIVFGDWFKKSTKEFNLPIPTLICCPIKSDTNDNGVLFKIRQQWEKMTETLAAEFGIKTLKSNIENLVFFENKDSHSKTLGCVNQFLT